MTDCPRQEILARFLHEELSEDELAVVAAHIDSCEVCPGRLDRLSRPAEESEWRRLRKTSELPAMALSSPRSPEFKGRLDHFDIEKKLGAGGMGAVYSARDTKLGRQVAVKVIRPEFAALPGFRNLFAREISTAAQVTSDFVVRVYSGSDGVKRRTLPYLVMELINGESLKGRIKREGALSSRDSALIALDIAKGLAAIHDLGLIHRDIKPANILLDSGSGRARITDFGLARTVTRSQDQVTYARNPGTPEYMSPEQFQNSGDIDGLSDQFSLGVVLYEMLTGKRPFPGKTLEELAKQVPNDNPQHPGRIVPKIPRDLEIICLKCLDKDPAHRYASARELADDLVRFLEHEPIVAKPPTLGRRAILLARRNRSVVMVTTGAVPILIALLIALVYEQGRRNDAVKGRSEAETTASLRTQEATDRKERERRTRYQLDVKDAYKSWDANQLVEARKILDKQKPDASGVADLRGSEWYYLNYVLEATGRGVDFGGESLAVCISPDEKHLATFGIAEDKTVGIKLWKLPGAEYERTLVLDRKTSGLMLFRDFAGIGGNEFIDFSEDGTLVAATYKFHHGSKVAGLVKVWETGTGREIFSASDTGLSGRAVLFSPDGEHIIAGGFNNVAFVWKISDGKLRWILPGYKPGSMSGLATKPDIARPGTNVGINEEVTHLLFTPKARYLIRGGAYNSRRSKWPPGDHPERDEQVPYEPTASGRIIAYTPSGSWGLSGDITKDGIRLFHPLTDTGDTRPIQGMLPTPRQDPVLIKNDQGDIKTIALKSDAVIIADTQGRLTAINFDVNSGSVYRRGPLRGHQEPVTSMAITQRSNRYLAACSQRSITLWNNFLEEPGNRLFGTALKKNWGVDSQAREHHTVDGRWEFRTVKRVSSGDPTPNAIVELYDLTAKQSRPREIVTPVKNPTALAISRDGTLLAISGDDPMIGNAMRRIRANDQKGPLHVIESDHAEVIKIHILNTQTDAIAREISVPRYGTNRLVFDSEGKTILAVLGTKKMCLWSVTTGELLRTFENQNHPSFVQAEYSPDGRWIVTCTLGSGTIFVWDVVRGEEKWRFDGMPGQPAWAFYEHLLAMPLDDGRIRAWDLEKGKFVQEVNLAGRKADHLAYFDSGRRLVSMSNGKLTLWDIETNSDVCTIPAPRLVDGQWPRIPQALDDMRKPAQQ